MSALVAVNALGDRRDPAEVRVPVPPPSRFEADPTNTTIGVVATNAALSKLACHLAAQVGARRLAPPSTRPTPPATATPSWSPPPAR